MIISKIGDFPQQQNNYDCGVFVIKGIKDVVNNTTWSFSQDDITSERSHIKSDLLNKEITDF